MHNFNIYSRRVFLDRSFKTGLAVALGTLADIPLVMKRALAEGSIGQPGPGGKIKKVLFIWLRFGNDGLNTVIPIQDSEYAAIRPDIGIQKDDVATNTLNPNYDPNYYVHSGSCFDASQYRDITDPINGTGTARTSADAVYSYNRAIRLGNGFAALHPALKFLAPVYNAGDLAVMHRVAYPRQSRSHFDSQNYWENGNPNNNLSKDGIFYRTIMESGLANTAPLTGISIQSALPLILRGSKAAMTNLTDPTRYDLLGVPNNNTTGDLKAFNAIAGANYFPFSEKRSRELLDLQYENMTNTLRIFGNMDFSETANTFRDDAKTDGDTAWYPGASNDAQGYYLFPSSDDKNGGYKRPSGGGNIANKRVVPQGQQSFFAKLKAAAMILNKTDAVIAGTEIGGFDTHQTQGAATGTHANLMQTVGWSMYALRKYFQNYADKADWENVVVVTLSEFGRTSVENNDNGTDHAEAGTMFVSGGAVKGHGISPSGVFGCSPASNIPWNPGPINSNVNLCGTMYAANPTVKAGYLRRAIDFRSVLGEVIRKHLGATQPQLNRIIPGYANPSEYLLNGGMSSIDGVQIHGELGIL